jgi:hypothetical protein
MDCTFCLDCVKACPHDNIGILVLPPGSDLVNDPIRSSLGRFSRRLDIAALALVLVFSAFVSAAAMVAPATAWRERLIELFPAISTGPVAGFLFLIALVLAPAIVMSAATAAGAALAHVAKPSHELFCRFSMALLPLGLAMWGAHVSFHLSSAWRTAWPVMQRATGDLGAGWFGTPRWTASSPLFAADVLLGGQVLLLDAGVLLSLYVGWRIARGYTSRPQDGVLLLIPWAIVVTALFAAGVWVVFQPMQMRGMVHG